MAKRSDATSFTGLYWPCGVNEIKHPRKPKVVPIAKGPKKFYISCVCRYFAYLPPDWHEKLGMTEAQAYARGFDVDVVITL